MKLNNSDKVMQDSALKLASAAYVKEEGERLLKEASGLNQTKNEEISKEEIEEFEKFCKKEFRKNEWKNSNFLKIVATVAVLALIINIGINYIPDYICVETSTTENYRGDDVKLKDLKYIPKYIPENLKQYRINKIQKKYKVCYEDNETIFVGFAYEEISDSVMLGFGEIKEDKEVNINGNAGKIQTGNQYVLTWIADNHLFTIKAQGITEEELIKIAESVKENK